MSNNYSPLKRQLKKILNNSRRMNKLSKYLPMRREGGRADEASFFFFLALLFPLYMLFGYLPQLVNDPWFTGFVDKWLLIAYVVVSTRLAVKYRFPTRQEIRNIRVQRG